MMLVLFTETEVLRHKNSAASSLINIFNWKKLITEYDQKALVCVIFFQNCSLCAVSCQVTEMLLTNLYAVYVQLRLSKSYLCLIASNLKTQDTGVFESGKAFWIGLRIVNFLS